MLPGTAIAGLKTASEEGPGGQIATTKFADKKQERSRSKKPRASAGRRLGALHSRLGEMLVC